MVPRSGKRPTCKCYLGERFILQWEVSSVHSLLDVTNIKADSALFHNARLSLSSAGTWQNDERAKNSSVADKSREIIFPQVSFYWCEKCESLGIHVIQLYIEHVHKAAAINMHPLCKVLHDNTFSCVKWNNAFLCFAKKSMQCTHSPLTSAYRDKCALRHLLWIIRKPYYTFWLFVHLKIV